MVSRVFVFFFRTMLLARRWKNKRNVRCTFKFAILNDKYYCFRLRRKKPSSSARCLSTRFFFFLLETNWWTRHTATLNLNLNHCLGLELHRSVNLAVWCVHFCWRRHSWSGFFPPRSCNTAISARPCYEYRSYCVRQREDKKWKFPPVGEAKKKTIIITQGEGDHNNPKKKSLLTRSNSNMCTLQMRLGHQSDTRRRSLDLRIPPPAPSEAPANSSRLRVHLYACHRLRVYLNTHVTCSWILVCLHAPGSQHQHDYR